MQSDNSAATALGTVITIDGPAGSGKSTVARLLAKSLGFFHLDSGAVYRTLTLAWVKELGAGADAEEFGDRFYNRVKTVENLPQLHGLRLEKGQQANYVGKDRVEEDIRTLEVTARVGSIADYPPCRQQVNESIVRLAQEHNIVIEGRDAGTNIFPQAGFKFFMDAKVDIRAERRFRQLQELGQKPSLQLMREEIERRDARDRSRPIGALERATGAMLIDTSDIEPAKAVAIILSHLQVRL